MRNTWKTLGIWRGLDSGHSVMMFVSMSRMWYLLAPFLCFDIIASVSLTIATLSWYWVDTQLILSWYSVDTQLILSWYWVDTELILSWYWVDIELILSWYSVDTQLILSWYWVDTELILSWYWVDIELILSWYSVDTQLILSWYWVDIELILSWYSVDTELILSWYWVDIELILSWYWVDIELILSWYWVDIELIFAPCAQCNTSLLSMHKLNDVSVIYFFILYYINPLLHQLSKKICIKFWCYQLAALCSRGLTQCCQLKLYAWPSPLPSWGFGPRPRKRGTTELSRASPTSLRTVLADYVTL